MHTVLSHPLFMPILVTLVVIAVFPLVAGYIVLVERKVLADFQVRLGPMRVGPHGLLQPNQLWTGRVVEGADKFATPVDGLYLCGQCTHPGPGVTGIPGWNGAEAALKHLDARVS